MLGRGQLSCLTCPGAAEPRTSTQDSFLLLLSLVLVAAKRCGALPKSCPRDYWLLLQDALQWGGEQASLAVPISSQVEFCKTFILNLPVVILFPGGAHLVVCSHSLNNHLVKSGVLIAFDIMSNVVFYC